MATWRIKTTGRKYLLAVAVIALFAGVFALFGGIYFHWYTAPYPDFGKTVAWAIGMPEPAYNFATVTPLKLYRSGLPDAEFLGYVHRRYGIKYLVSLVGSSENHRVAESLGMKVVVLDWRKAAPSAQELRAVLDFLNERDGVLLHCHAGRDRTGFVVALQRMQQQHWSVERALQEMEAYGHSRSRRSETSRALRQWREQF